ncbi:hypothetical protein GCM10023196_070950 [Actinoallomurus vinaceus]|uniref:Membrane protein YmcC n=1 Tax=Actinoallomurus vinaceus TaxID=1080074 RepID=A0ABP8UNT5_9ACTN
MIIAGCEVGFWLFLLMGLLTRYVARRPRLGAALLICVPLTDLALLTATVVDLRRGATAGFAHGLAAAYLGFSVAFGHGMIRWADERFAHRFAGGPSPSRPPRHGRARARHEWKEFGKAVIAWAISCALLLGAIALVGDTGRTAALHDWLSRLTVVLGIWALWPITYTIWPAKPKKASR